ncbi:MAG: nucleotide exchange factor GrpE [bacterium]
MDVHKDKLEELKQALKHKKDAEMTKQSLSEESKGSIKEELTLLQKMKQELEAKVASLEGALAQAQAQAKDNNDKFIRQMAEFDNYRKRAQREKEEYTRYAHEEAVKDMLPVMDDLERALTHAQSAAEIPALIEGVEMVKKQLGTTLEKYGLKTFDSLGEPFNPHVHEAVAHVESMEYPPDTVAAEYRKGYTLHGKLVRPALVAVSKTGG